jgi:hypothetical protein
MNIFEEATRLALRFNSNKGSLTTEQLWTMPLTHTSGFDLDTVAKQVSRELKANTEESFVTPTTSAAQSACELRLAVVKHIIAVKLAEVEDRKQAASRKAEKQRLMEILADKQDAGLKELSVEEIQKRIDAL